MHKRRRFAELASLDVCAWDQQGCFSPQEIYVETGGSVSPKEFAGLLAKEMERTTRALPKGTNSGKMQVLDGYYQYFTKETMGEPVKIFPSKENQWLVIYDESNQNCEPSPLFRVIRVKPIADIMEILRRSDLLGRSCRPWVLRFLRVDCLPLRMRWGKQVRRTCVRLVR